MRIHKKNKFFKIILIFFVLLLSLIIYIILNKIKFITNNISYIIITPKKIINNIENKISNSIKIISNKNKIIEENTNLKETIEELLKETNRAKVLEKDNIYLRSLIDINQKYPYLYTVGADIISRDNNNWKNSFLINKGKNDGIHENMIVLASGGLVGHISKVGKNYAKVIPIIEDSSCVGAVSLRTNDFGFVRGSFDLNKYGLAKMDFINPNSQLAEGDEIITSNLSKIYPPGILIGYVKEFSLNNNSITATATIQPIVNFKNLETVLIVKEIFAKNFD